jgi:signal transduction histidine kinase/CheY-like chemotaxis protein
MFSLQLLFNKVRRIGIRPGIPDDDVRRIMIVNAFSFLTALLCTFCGVSMSVISGDWLICWTAMAFVAGFLSVLLFNHKGRFAVAKFGLQLVYCSVMLYYGCVFGESAQVPFLGLFLIGVPLLVCSPREKALRFCCLTLPLLTLFLLETNYYYKVFTPMELSRTGIHLFRWLIMTVVVVLNFMVITFYLQNINGLLKQLHWQNESLEKRNQVVMQKEKELKSANRLLETYSEKLEGEVSLRTRELMDQNVVQEIILANLRKSMLQLEEKDAELESYVAELESLKSSLVKARDEAERANTAKSAFLRELSHEIRNPLNAILGISYLLMKGGDERMPPDVAKYVENINVSGHNLLGIINNVLELARIEAGKTDDVREEPMVLREWINNLAGVYRHAAQVKDVSIHVQIDHKLPLQLMGDKVHLTQVMNNLLGNAVKFTPASRKVTLSCFRQGADRWNIRVTNEGEGIPQDRLGHIFHPFEQADDTIHKRFGGTGLGLTISKRIVELLGGTIGVWSEPGSGTCFTVTLPLRQGGTVRRKDAPVPAAKAPEKTWVPPGKSILLMEDSAVNRLVLEEFLDRMGLPLLVAEDGESGLKMAREHLPDVIILDMHMPKLNGHQVVRELRRDPLLQHVPVIVISADAFREQQVQALKEGVNEYLIKPIQFDELKNALAKYLRNTIPATAV